MCRSRRRATSAISRRVFFPLYPLLIHLVGMALGGHYLLSALLISNLGARRVYIGLALLAAHEFGSARTPSYAVTMLAAYPLVFFLAAPYSEGLFIALAAFALYGARTSRWRVAAACAFFAALTRPTGIILLAPLVWEYGRQRGWWANWRNAGSWRARLGARLCPQELATARWPA